MGMFLCCCVIFFLIYLKVLKCINIILRCPNIVFQRLEKDIISFVKNELKNTQNALSSECCEIPRADDENAEQMRSIKEAFVKITVLFLQMMKQQELADFLQSSKRISI